MFAKTLAVLAFTPLLAFAAEEPLSATVENVSPTPWSIRATDHFIFSQAPDDAADKSLPSTKTFMNEIKLSGEYGAYNGFVQFSNRYTPDGPQSRNAPIKFEKKLLAYEGEAWSVKLGDSHQEYGKGIALSLYSDTAIGIDNTVEGASVKYEDSVVRASTFAGRANTLRSPVAINPDIDRLLKYDVWLGGAETSVAYSKTGRAGVHAVGTMNQDYENKRIKQRQYTLGVTLSQESIVEGLDFYLETNYLNTERIDPTREQAPDGYGSYAAVTYSELPWKFKLEGKDFRSFHYDWQRPPTLEEDVVRENNFKDVTAARMTIERRILEGYSGSVFASYLAGEDRHLNSFISHPVVGSKFPLGSSVEMEMRGGYRWAPNRQNLIHASAKTKVKTWKAQAFELEYRKQFWNLALDSSLAEKEERNIFLAGYTFNEKFSAAVGYEYVPTNPAETGKNFLNAGGTYREGSLSTRAFVGQTSGGTQCNGGICRVVPPYTGAYLEGTVTF